MKMRIAAAVVLIVAGAVTRNDLYAQEATPEATREFDFSNASRWKKLSRDTFASPGPYLGAAIGGAFDLAGDSPKEWGQDGDSYGVHVADNFGRNLIQQTVSQSGQAILGLDPTYRRCRCSGVFRRIGNAFAGSITSFDESGRRRFDPMRLAGAYGSGMLGAYWYPRRYDPLVKGVQLGHEQFAGVPLSNLFSEFSPELKRLNPFRRKDP